ncbi:MAG: GntR family transcriptional regulator [Lachnospiraceae bacterium]
MKGILNSQSLIYKQITELIEDGILNGNYATDEQVPSTNEISRVLSVNPATAAKGVNLLVDEGILYKKRGIGMFVNKGAQMKLLESRRVAFREEDVVTFIRCHFWHIFRCYMC